MRRRREFYILNCSNAVLTAIVFYSLLIGECWNHSFDNFQSIARCPEAEKPESEEEI